ncbi:MAG TPA: dTDP-glucose 4,6-dehydratase, partial [Gammaproteobacteria bacterium]|nr:dTDP-glucose 4,6-dehydratase [Gammaproteobacteria bacterium]
SIVAGTMNNCAGGVTPWGTWLMAEENFNLYFLGNLDDDHPEARNHKRYGLSRALVNWGLYEKRFNIEEEPTEPNRFGWIVEVDPLNSNAMPKKRTALGRFKHEGAETVLAPDGRVVVYMGDDQRFDYVYKFISKSPYESKEMNENLLDEGTLYVARFNEDGTLDWLPLIFGQGPLTIENDFDSQAEVLIETRRAADLLGATPMDRPEDIQPDATTGRAWVMLTNNDRRTKKQTDKANPRADNQTGHIIEIIEPNKDFAATRSRWEILVKCGDPSDESNASWHVTTTENGWFGSPDNAEVDEQGRLWVSTDGNQDTGAADGIWMIETNGYERGKSKAFFRAPLGAEVSGPQFSPDFRTLFLAVQHPGDTEGSNFENPATRWPDFDQQLPPRPSIIAVRRDDNQKIGT